MTAFSRMALLGIVGAAGLLASSAGAMAACQNSAYKFMFQGDTATSEVTITGGGTCRFAFHSGHSAMFQSADIVVKPAHGALSAVGKDQFTYVAAKSYKGSDAFQIKACGSTKSGPGCSTITYNVTVN